MCKSWFTREDISWPHSKYTFLLEGINDYPGTSHDLSGCVNDIALAVSKTYNFQHREFLNSQVTVRRTKDQLNYLIDNCQPGDVIWWQYSGHGSYVKDLNNDEIDGVDETLYLYDGNLIDDDTNAILDRVPEDVLMVVFLDSCFSGGAARNNPLKYKSRFVQPNIPVPNHVRLKNAVSRGHNRIVFSACKETETAADALINNQWNGAFSFYLWNTYNPTLTYRQWFNNLLNYLPNENFSQTPTIEGPDHLLDKLILT